MKSIKIILRITLTLIWYPALIIHELSHAVIAILFFQKPTSISFVFPRRFDKPLSGAVFFSEEQSEPNFSNFMICLAPFFSLIFSIVLSFFFPFFTKVFIYQLLAFHYTLPSNSDLNSGLPFLGIKNKFTDYKFEKKLTIWLYTECTEENKKLNEFNEIKSKLD